MNQVREICQDYEHRCHDTETPLRAVEEQRDKLSFETEQLKQQESELEDQLQQVSSTISSMEKEKTYLDNYAHETSARVEELSAKLEEMQKESGEKLHNSEETARRELEAARTRELELIANVTEKDDRIEELEEEINQELRCHNQTKKALDTVSKEKAESLQNAVSLRQEIGKLEQSLESVGQTVTGKDEKIQRLLADHQFAKEGNEVLQKQVRGL